MKRFSVFLFVCFLTASGCNRTPPPNEGKPGVHIDVQPKREGPGKVKVDGPGVHVDVEKKPG